MASTAPERVDDVNPPDIKQLKDIALLKDIKFLHDFRKEICGAWIPLFTNVLPNQGFADAHPGLLDEYMRMPYTFSDVIFIITNDTGWVDIMSTFIYIIGDKKVPTQLSVYTINDICKPLRLRIPHFLLAFNYEKTLVSDVLIAAMKDRQGSSTVGDITRQWESELMRRTIAFFNES